MRNRSEPCTWQPPFVKRRAFRHGSNSEEVSLSICLPGYLKSGHRSMQSACLKSANSGSDGNSEAVFLNGTSEQSLIPQETKALRGCERLGCFYC